MAEMSNEINTRLRAFTEELEPIRQAAERLVDQTAKLEIPEGTILISHRPAIGTEAYAIVLHPGVPEERIAGYEEIQSGRHPASFGIPWAYRALLQVLNGADLFQMSLYGLPGSMSRGLPLLNRLVRQPLDLATANFNWKRQYKPCESQFHFGSGPYSNTENVGYFLNPDQSVEIRRAGGEIFGAWASMGIFLAQEIIRVESLFPSYESSMSELRQMLERQGKTKRPRKK